MISKYYKKADCRSVKGRFRSRQIHNWMHLQCSTFLSFSQWHYFQPNGAFRTLCHQSLLCRSWTNSIPAWRETQYPFHKVFCAFDTPLIMHKSFHSEACKIFKTSFHGGYKTMTNGWRIYNQLDKLISVCSSTITAYVRQISYYCQSSVTFGIISPVCMFRLPSKFLIVYHFDKQLYTS